VHHIPLARFQPLAQFRLKVGAVVNLITPEVAGSGVRRPRRPASRLDGNGDDGGAILAGPVKVLGIILSKEADQIDLVAG